MKIPFETVKLNQGRAMDIGTGIFTAPKSGHYSFHFSGFKDALVSELYVVLRLNGQTDLASSYVGNAKEEAPIFLHCIVSLKTGDKVSLYLMEGSIASSSHGNSFFGYILEQDLSFEWEKYIICLLANNLRPHSWVNFLRNMTS